MAVLLQDYGGVRGIFIILSKMLKWSNLYKWKTRELLGTMHLYLFPYMECTYLATDYIYSAQSRLWNDGRCCQTQYIGIRLQTIPLNHVKD